jgi:membrane protein
MISWFTRRFWPRLYRAANKWQEDDGLTWAASLGYYGAFSFFPLVLVIIAGAGIVLSVSPSARVQKQQLIVDPIRNQFSPALGDEVDKIMSGVQTSASTSGPVGLATLVLGAIGIFMQLEAAFDRIWKVTADGGPKRTIWRILRTVLFTRLRAFLMLIGVGLIVLLAFMANMVLSGVSRYTDRIPLGAVVFHLMQLGLSAFLNGLMFTLIYRVIPKRHVAWKQAVAGGLVAGIAWEIGRQLLAFLIVGKSYTAYGVIGSFIVLMLWFYYASMVLLFGAEFVAVGSNRRSESLGP